MTTIARAYLAYSIFWALLFVAWIPYAVMQVRRVLPMPAEGGALVWLPLGCSGLFIALICASQIAYFLYLSRCIRKPELARYCKGLCWIGALSFPIGSVLAVFALRALAREKSRT